jgi:hypothetical protein
MVVQNICCEEKSIYSIAENVNAAARFSISAILRPNWETPKKTFFMDFFMKKR